MVDAVLGVRLGRLEMRSSLEGATHFVSLAGDLDAEACPGVELELIRAERNGAQQVLVDLSRLLFIDSTGISLLVAAMRRSAEDSGWLRFIPSESEDVRRLLELCGLEGQLPLVDGRSG